MEMLPDHAIEVIVAGLEAAVRRIEGYDFRVTVALSDPRILHHVPSDLRDDILAIRDAVKKLEDLRIARYIREPKR
jgi:hypothetical protein